MNDLKHIGALCLLGLSAVLVVGGGLFFGSGAEDVLPRAPLGRPLSFVWRVVTDTGFGPMVGIAVLLLLAALFVYPWRLPPDALDLETRAAEPGVWPPTPVGPVVAQPEQPIYHWARPDPDE